MIGYLLLFFSPCFFSVEFKSCDKDDNTCLKRFQDLSVEVSLWRDFSYNSKYKDSDLFLIGDWVFVVCEVDEEYVHEHSIAFFNSIIARPIPRQMYRASLIKSSKNNPEMILPKAIMSDLEVDKMDGEKRGFHFRVEKEVFDFREYESQEEVYVEVKIVLNILDKTYSTSHNVEKIFFMRITDFESCTNEKGSNVVIYSHDKNLKGLLSLPNAGEHQYTVKRDERTASIFWYHYFYQAENRFQKTPTFSKSGKYVAINHIMSQKHIGEKDSLTETLRRRNSMTSKFYPTTFLLSSEKERTSFETRLMEDEGDQFWILKAGGLSEGRGTKFISKINNQLKINEIEISHPRELVQHLKFEEKEIGYISQKYIHNPMLYKGYKIGIRQFWLIASIKPLRVLLYDTGFCTFGSSLYENVNFDDMSIHLTNYDQQPDDNKPEFTYVKHFRDYLIQEGMVNESWYEDVFRNQVKNVLIHTAKCYNESILENGRDDILNFGLFGADFVMDQEHVLWLNEVQRSSSLRHTGKCLKSLFMPEMIVETLDIVHEIRKFGERNGGLTDGLKELKSIKKFEWLINDVE